MNCLGSPVGLGSACYLGFGSVVRTSQKYIFVLLLVESIFGLGLCWFVCHDQLRFCCLVEEGTPVGRRVPHPSHHKLEV